jgi:hypothetical protein
VPLVGAGGAGVALLEQVEADVLARQVPPDRELGLEQRHGPGRVGQRETVEGHRDVPRAGQDVDPLVRVVRVAEHRLLLLEPAERAEVEHHVAVQVLVVRPERGAGEVATAGPDGERLPGRGVPGVVRGAEHLRQVVGRPGRGLRDQLRGEVPQGHRVDRDHTARLPHEQGRRGVHDGPAVELAADPLRGGLDAQLAQRGPQVVSHS